MNRANKVVALTAGFFLPLLLPASGCIGELCANLIEERSGNVSIIIINNTPYRASFSFGSYDAFDRDPGGEMDFQQRRVERLTSTSPVNLTCRRNVAIGTADLLQRAIVTEKNKGADFDADAFVAVVNFSSADADSNAAALPTVGTAEGLEVLLGVDYKCGDQLIFTLVEDATAAGGFRIEYRVLPAEQETR